MSSRPYPWQHKLASAKPGDTVSIPTGEYMLEVPPGVLIQSTAIATAAMRDEG